MRGKRKALVIALLAVMAAMVGVAQAGTIFVVSYAGKTSQAYAGKPSPSIAIDVDRTHRAVHYIGIAYKCPKSGTAWISKAYPTVKHGKINRKGDFKYTLPRGKTHLSWISGHVTSAKITGKFAAKQLGCNATGTYTATLGGK